MKIITYKDLDIALTYRKMKTIRLRVKPDASVHVSSPYGVSEKEIKQLIEKRYDWIVSTRHKMLHSPKIAAEQASKEQTDEWKRVIQACVPALVSEWESIMGVKVYKLAYRNMTSRWGSCNVQTHRVCINTRLALYPPQCLEYVVVHELCHLLEPSHNKRFHSLMTHFMPDWKERKRLLDS